MDGVARRAGVGKSTVYLRWQDKDSLLTDAIGSYSDKLGAVDTGSLRGDLEALATNLFEYYRDPAGWASLRIIIDSAGAQEALGRFAEDVGQVQIDFVEQILRRAADRGEIAPGMSAATTAECLYGSVMMCTLGLRLESRAATDEEIAARVAEFVGIMLDGVCRPAGP
ncbi:hypothetical protein GCM10027062_40410 [Nocardioides hungaricus]